MNPTLVLVAAIVVIVVVAALAVWRPWARMSPEGRMRSHYGAEYDRLVSELGSPGAAEQALREREERVRGMDIRALSVDEWNRFDAEWRDLQAGFVDDPEGAVKDAEGLVGQLAEARGYPAADFEQRAADLSVDHPDAIEAYRRARELGAADDSGETAARTEDLRLALLDYRDVFKDLLGRESDAERTEQAAA